MTDTRPKKDLKFLVYFRLFHDFVIYTQTENATVIK